MTGNRIVGLHIPQTASSTPLLAIEICGAGHTISGNRIGIHSAGTTVGVCGQGIKGSGSHTQIVDNTITRSRTRFEDARAAAMLASDISSTFGQITVRCNLVEARPGAIYTFGAAIPAVLCQFRPVKITSISRLEVRGGNGPGSPCPGCLIDFYLDDNDPVARAFSYQGSTVTAANGSFTFTLPAALAPGTGISTSSTTQSATMIGTYLAGATTEFSPLYERINRLSLPLLRR